MKIPNANLSLFVAATLVALLAGCGRIDGDSVSAANGTEQPAPPNPGEGGSPPLQAETSAETASDLSARDQPRPEVRLPRLVDVGAGTCIPCRLMKPILDELQATRAHQFETVYIDLNHQRDEAGRFKIRVIPTQIFYDENGRERGRHEGFMSKEQILEAWRNLGYEFD